MLAASLQISDFLHSYCSTLYCICVINGAQLVGTLEDRLAEWAKRKPKFYYSKKRKASLLKAIQYEKSQQQVLSLARALEHLHGYHILHRDIKPANIGFDANGTLKIFDFDLARVLPLGRDRLFQLTRNVGSPRYMAPEVKLGDKYNLTADVFSFGVVVYEIFTLKNFGSPQQCDWGKKNKRIPPSFSANLRSILEQCLARSNTDRPHMDRVRRILKAEIDEDSADLRYGMMELTNLNLDSSSLWNWENTTPRRMLPSVPSAKFKTCASDDISRSQRTTETEAETAVLTDRLPHHTDKANGCDNTNPVLWV